MKNLIFLLCFLLAFVGFAQDKPTTPQIEGAYLSFDNAEHDFGDIKEGETVKVVFKFTNTGTKPLLLSNINTTCGCTASDWSVSPVFQNEKGEITISFDSTDKAGVQTKIITVFSNAVNNQERIKIKANVLPK